MAYDRIDERRKVSLQQHTRLKNWSERRPCVALMGEFSAGKSTLLNFLIEDDLLPTRATATELPPVWFSQGTGGSHWVDENGATHPITNADIRKVPMSARFIRIFAEAEILEHCDIIDTPGISDPNLAVESWRFAAGQANMVLWCTSATQAWRETERGAWSSLPERLRKHSVLVVTRADKLLTDLDREKVARRMKRETAEFFNSSLFMATPDAVRAKAELAEDEASPLWVSSGAEALLDKLAERFEAIYEERVALLARYEIVGEGAVRARRPDDIRPEPKAPDGSDADLRNRRAPYAEDDGAYRLEEADRADDLGEAPSGPVPTRPTRPERPTAVRPARPSAEAAAELRARLQETLAAEPDEDEADEGAVLGIAEEEIAANDVSAAADEGDADREAGTATHNLAVVVEDEAVAGTSDGEDDETASGAPNAGLSGDDVDLSAEPDAEVETPATEATQSDEEVEISAVEATEPDAVEVEDEAMSDEDEQLRAALGDDEVDEEGVLTDEAEPEAVSTADDEAPEAEAVEPSKPQLATANEATEAMPEQHVASATEPRELQLWRKVLQRHPAVEQHAPVIALIEDFLTELYGKTEAEGASQEVGVADQADGDTDAKPTEESGAGSEDAEDAPSWRRLA